MVFKSQNKIRNCRWCSNPAKINMSSGRNKGYYRTCGSKECLKQQYKDKCVSLKKGRIENGSDLVCFICGDKFIRKSANHKKYCLECVPDKNWRDRANLYHIGKKQWDELLAKQDFKCALCNKNPETVDHCHISKVVRGLLCGGCNMQIARFENDLQWLKRSLDYLGIKL